LPGPSPPSTTDLFHREQAVIGRIFQALPTQTNTTVALIYRIGGPKGWNYIFQNITFYAREVQKFFFFFFFGSDGLIKLACCKGKIELGRHLI
jgi:hypothetical protein